MANRHSLWGLSAFCGRALARAFAGALLVALAMAVGVGCAPFPIEPMAYPAWTATAIAQPPTATATAAPTSTATSPKPTAAPAPLRTPVASPPAKASLSNLTIDDTAQIASRIADLRGLPFKNEVTAGVLNRDQLRAYLVSAYEKENAKERLEKDKALLVMLDLVNETDDLYELSLSALTQQIFGFYDFDSREMKLVADGSSLGPREELALAHEYVHALQDQHYNIGARIKEASGDSEKSMALRSLSEGDATLFMGMYAQKHLTPSQQAALSNNDRIGAPGQDVSQTVPPVLQWQLLFPYLHGMSFAMSMFQNGGAIGLQQSYDRPPVTTEQIMHVQKYLMGEGPQDVKIPDLTPVLGTGWSNFHEDTLGEFGLWCYIRGRLPDDVASRASSGWGGDRARLYKNAEGRYALAVLTTWDTPQEATEFFETMGYLLEARKDTRVTSLDNQHRSWSSPEQSGYVTIRDKQVLIAMAPDEQTASRLVGGLETLSR